MIKRQVAPGVEALAFERMPATEGQVKMPPLLADADGFEEENVPPEDGVVLPASRYASLRSSP